MVSHRAATDRSVDSSASRKQDATRQYAQNAPQHGAEGLAAHQMVSCDSRTPYEWDSARCVVWRREANDACHDQRLSCAVYATRLLTDH